MAHSPLPWLCDTCESPRNSANSFWFDSDWGTWHQTVGSVALFRSVPLPSGKMI